MKPSASFGPRGAAAAASPAFGVVGPAPPVPPDLPIRGTSRPDAALAVDRELVDLAGAGAHGRLLQARLCARMMALRGWQRLGFVRLSDYSRERLGLSSRTLEEDALVLRSLASLPRLGAATESGSISWTKLRLLVRAATVQNEALLLKAATQKTTRELEGFLRDVAKPPRDRGKDVAGRPPPTEDEPRVRWDIAVSRNGRRMWRAACEMAARMAGSPLPRSEVLELVCAETSSGMAHAPPGGGLHLLPPEEAIESRLLDQEAAGERRGERRVRSFRDETGVVEGFPWLHAAGAGPGPAVTLDHLLDGLEGTDAFEVDRRLRTLRTAMQRVDAQVATLLRISTDRRLYRELGFATFKLYVESRLGMSSRKAASLVAIERASRRSCTALREAWRLGEISHLAASALLPVLDQRHGRAWVQRAREVTLRRLHDEVAWTLDRSDRHPALDRPGPPPPDADVRADALPGLSRDEVQMRAHDPAAWDTVSGPPGAVRLALRVPLSVAVLAETTLWLLRRSGEPRWRTFERAVAMALLEWTSLPGHRDPVFARDGWRCTVPGCSSRRNLHDHHVIFRSHGGGNARGNRTTVCAAHHAHGIHGGVIRAYGTAPHGISWELGCRRGGAPLMRLRGDRYVLR